MSNTVIVTGYDCLKWCQGEFSNDQVQVVTIQALQNCCLQQNPTIETADGAIYRSALMKVTSDLPNKRSGGYSRELLEELKNTNPSYRFLLLYEAPESTFVDVYKCSGGDLSQVKIALEEWAVVNRVILDFFQGNRDICALVHSSTSNEQPSELLDICYQKMGKELSLGFFDDRCSPELSLEALAPHLIEEFTEYQKLYIKLQLSASLPGLDLNQTGNPLLRKKYLASRAAEALLTGGDKLVIDELIVKNNELEQEVALSQLQINQLYEELEHYFLKYEELKEVVDRKEEVIEQSAISALPHSSRFDHASTVAISGSYSDSGYRDVHLNIHDFSLSDGRYFASFRCKLALIAGIAALEFRETGEVATDGVSDWPKGMEDEYGKYLLFSPGAKGEEKLYQQSMLNELCTEDRQLIFSVINVLRDHFLNVKVDDIAKLPADTARDWRMAAIALSEKAIAHSDFISVDEIRLREEFVCNNYSHLWFECRNLQLRSRVFPSYSFKFSAYSRRDGYRVALEFRDLHDNKPPLDAWPTQEIDEFGCKLLVNLVIRRGRIHVDASERLTRTDRVMISSIIKKLPSLIKSLENGGFESGKGWDFWQKLVVGLDQKKLKFVINKRNIIRIVKARLIG
ncbi:hypothetical protein M0G74_08775 [Microbulbifer sp. CAU 1566]|uniref:hypothetical protein n=1 Tax=Microbulbifer sp. CAU 1566 TaxID=2933269 RepID=UPI002003EDD0|nr:hypothetical protein [Microbulbifer sp. CAU 1566]MCK7597363.1 hypothetical protein [Microbulbifer sp. CAU 1566]